MTGPRVRAGTARVRADATRRVFSRRARVGAAPRLGDRLDGRDSSRFPPEESPPTGPLFVVQTDRVVVGFNAFKPALHLPNPSISRTRKRATRHARAVFATFPGDDAPLDIEHARMELKELQAMAEGKDFFDHWRSSRRPTAQGARRRHVVDAVPDRRRDGPGRRLHVHCGWKRGSPRSKSARSGSCTRQSDRRMTTKNGAFARGRGRETRDKPRWRRAKLPRACNKSTRRRVWHRDETSIVSLHRVVMEREEDEIAIVDGSVRSQSIVSQVSSKRHSLGFAFSKRKTRPRRRGQARAGLL